MIIGIQGSKNFNDYSVFLFAMRATLQDLGDDKEFVILSAGPHRVNEMAMEFINVSNWRSRGIKAKVVKMPPLALEERLYDIDRLLYLSLKKESLSDLARGAQDKDIDVRVYRFA